MGSDIKGLVSLIVIFVCLFVIVVVVAQRTGSDSIRSIPHRFPKHNAVAVYIIVVFIEQFDYNQIVQ